MRHSELVVGEIYSHSFTYGSGQTGFAIFKYRRPIDHVHDIPWLGKHSNRFIAKHSPAMDGNYNIADKQDKEWLEACIRQNKFVPLENIVNKTFSFEEEIEEI